MRTAPCSPERERRGARVMAEEPDEKGGSANPVFSASSLTEMSVWASNRFCSRTTRSSIHLLRRTPGVHDEELAEPARRDRQPRAHNARPSAWSAVALEHGKKPPRARRPASGRRRAGPTRSARNKRRAATRSSCAGCTASSWRGACSASICSPSTRSARDRRVNASAGSPAPGEARAPRAADRPRCGAADRQELRARTVSIHASTCASGANCWTRPARDDRQPARADRHRREVDDELPGPRSPRYAI